MTSLLSVGKSVKIIGLNDEKDKEDDHSLKIFNGLEGFVVKRCNEEAGLLTKYNVAFVADGKIFEKTFQRRNLKMTGKRDGIFKGRGVMPNVVWENLKHRKEFGVREVEDISELLCKDTSSGDDEDDERPLSTASQSSSQRRAPRIFSTPSPSQRRGQVRNGERRVSSRPRLLFRVRNQIHNSFREVEDISELLCKDTSSGDDEDDERPLFTRFVVISDTHGRHRKIPEENISCGDVLLHCGDFTNTGEVEQIRDFVKWLGEICAKKGFKRCVVIAGNHDVTLHSVYYHTKGEKRFHRPFGKGKYTSKEARSLLLSLCPEKDRIVYLEDSGAVIENFLMWGSPWQPEFCDWAFNLKRGDECQAAWSMIPNDVQILLTHGPALGRGDMCSSGLLAGCEDLLYTIAGRLKRLRLHCAGHVHEGYGAVKDNRGVCYINGSTCTHRYIPSNPSIVVDIPTPSDEVGEKNRKILQSHMKALRETRSVAVRPKCIRVTETAEESRIEGKERGGALGAIRPKKPAA